MEYELKPVDEIPSRRTVSEIKDFLSVSSPTCIDCGRKAHEEHHTSYDPPVKVWLCRKCHQKRHNVEVIDDELTLVMRQYNAYIKMGTGLKNRAAAWQKDFGELKLPLYNEFLGSVAGEKKTLLKEAKLVMGKEYADLEKKWKGIGPVIVAQLLAFAHPKRFPSLRKFLYYCGRKEQAKKNKNYSRIASATAFQAASGLIKGKNEEYRPIYDEIKESLTERYADLERKGKKAMVNGMTLNRLSTLWLKDFYHTVRGMEDLI